MTQVYIIRHAEAEGNLYRRIHGWYDSRLTQTGLKQLEHLKKRFENIHLDAVYSSDLLRTRLTADAVAHGSDLIVQTTPNLREVGMGIWEDKPWGEVGEFDREQYINFSNSPNDWHVEGSEPFVHLQDRMENAILELSAKHDGKIIVCATLGYAIRALLCRIMRLSAHEICKVSHCDNTGVTLLKVDNGNINIVYHNDASHIPDSLSPFRNQVWWKNKDGKDNTVLWFKPTESAKNSHKAFSAILETTPVGHIELDTERDSEQGLGYISDYYLLPEYLGKGFSVQLLGQAVSFYRAMGRNKLAIHIEADVENLVKYFEHYGFSKVGIKDGLLSMEMDIKV